MGCCITRRRASSPPIDWQHQSADPLLIPEGRRILDWMYTLPTRANNRVISGQYHLDHINTIHNETGAWVSILLDRTISDMSGWAQWRNTRPAEYKTHWNNGGLIQENPTFGNPANKTAATDKAFSAAQMSQLMTTGTAVHNNFFGLFDTWCDLMEPVAAANIPVMLRIFHEMNGDIFWWHQAGAAAFVDLWEYIFNYVTKVRGLHNFLWCFSPTRYAGNFMTWYPSQATVDITGLSFYLEVSNSPSLNYAASDFTTTNAYIAATGKPFLMLEFGPHAGKISTFTAKADYSKILPAIKAYCPRCIGWCSWSDQWSMKAAYSVNAATALNDPWTVNRDELPDFTAP